MSYKAILTTVGREIITQRLAVANTSPFYQIILGDGNGADIEPNVSMTALVNPLLAVDVELVGTHSQDATITLVAASVLQSSVEFTAREAGILDPEGHLIAIASIPDSEIPTTEDNKYLLIRFALATGLHIPPSWYAHADQGAYITPAVMTEQSTYLNTLLDTADAMLTTINGIDTDTTTLVDSSILRYDSGAAVFKADQPLPNITPVAFSISEALTLEPGTSTVVTHQPIPTPAVIYQAEQLLTEPTAKVIHDYFDGDNVIFNNAKKFENSGQVWYSCNYSVTSITSSASSTTDNMPYLHAVTYGCDGYRYLLEMMTAVDTPSTKIRRASALASNTTTLLTDELPVAMHPNAISGMRVFEIGEYLYLFGNHILRAHRKAPTKFARIGTPPALYSGAVYVVGDRIYIVGGTTDLTTPNTSDLIYSADVNDLDNWRLETNRFPVTIAHQGYYQHGDMLYSVGGETTWDGAPIATIYTAPVSNPTAWTNAGMLPIAITRVNAIARLFDQYWIGCGRLANGTYLNKLYSASIATPGVWNFKVGYYAGVAGRVGGFLFALNTGILIQGGMEVSQTVTTAAVTFYVVKPNDRTTVTYIETVPTDVTDGVINSITCVGYMLGTACAVPVLTVDNGQTWLYWNGSAIVATPDKNTAIMNCSNSITTSTVDGYVYIKYPYFNNLAITGPVRMLLVFKTILTGGTTQRLVKYQFSVTANNAYTPLTAGTPDDMYSDIGIEHAAPPYTSTTVKNKTSAPVTIRLKVRGG